MIVHHQVSATAQQRRHLFGQNVAHAHGVELDEFGKHLAELALQVVTVLLHLPGEVFTRQQGIETCVHRCIDIGRQVGCHVVNALGQQILVYLIEQVLYQRRVALQGIGKGIADSS